MIHMKIQSNFISGKTGIQLALLHEKSAEYFCVACHVYEATEENIKEAKENLIKEFKKWKSHSKLKTTNNSKL